MNTLTSNPSSTVENPKLSPACFTLPSVDIVETPDAFRLEADMPGVSKAGLEVLVDGDELTILGRRNPALPGAEYRYREAKCLGYRRVFTLGPAIDAAQISARMEKGVLTLLLPKSERVKPRTVTIAD